MKPERITEGNPIEAWRQHLLDAAGYIERNGLNKGSCFDQHSAAACVGGALMNVGVHDFWTSNGKEMRALEARLGCPISIWNDRPETTKQMAVDALIGAALS